MGAKIIYEKSKYRCADYKESDTGTVIFSGGQTTKKYPITCYSHTPITRAQLQNRTYYGATKPSTTLTKFTQCNGHRKIFDSSITRPNAIAKIGGLSKADQINNVRDAISKEIDQRQKHLGMYSSISDAESAIVTGSTEYKEYIVKLQSEITNADKEERGYPNKQINFTQYVSASDLNILKDITIQVMDDCICYSDCNSYAVCWCHGYCNYY